MIFIIMHETVTTHDAIGNDIELMYNILNEKHECYVYACNHLNNNVKYITEEELDQYLMDPNTVVIYHHSVRWEHGYEKTKMAKGKVIFRYHNITPEHFFEHYNDFAYEQCKQGRGQTERMQKENRKAYWLCASYFNASDLNNTEKERIGVCPPFNKIEEWGRKTPDENILKELIENQKLNILFVGRVAPNKGHLMLLDVIRNYCSYYDCNIKLRVIGKFDEGIPGYNELVKNRIKEYQLENIVEFIGEINDSTLMAYYLGSDVLLCCSNHEGFCVPIVEAQYFHLPIVALNECAVPETIGKNQLLFENDVKKFAAALREIYNNTETARFLGKEGRKNYDNRFTYQQIRKQFTYQLQKAIGVKL